MTARHAIGLLLACAAIAACGTSSIEIATDVDNGVLVYDQGDRTAYVFNAGSRVVAYAGCFQVNVAGVPVMGPQQRPTSGTARVQIAAGPGLIFGAGPNCRVTISAT